MARRPSAGRRLVGVWGATATPWRRLGRRSPPGVRRCPPLRPPFRIKVARQRSLLQRGELQLSEIVRGMLIIVLGRLHLRGVNKV
jgi:hypothetical protein